MLTMVLITLFLELTLKEFNVSKNKQDYIKLKTFFDSEGNNKLEKECMEKKKIFLTTYPIMDKHPTYKEFIQPNSKNNNFKRGKTPGYIFFQRRYTNGQQVFVDAQNHCHQGNENQNDDITFAWLLSKTSKDNQVLACTLLAGMKMGRVIRK